MSHNRENSFEPHVESKEEEASREEEKSLFETVEVVKIKGEFNSVPDFRVSGSLDRITLIVNDKDKSYVVDVREEGGNIIQQRGEEFDGIVSLVASDDGSCAAYSAIRPSNPERSTYPNEMVLYVNNEKEVVADFYRSIIENLAVRPDGEEVAYSQKNSENLRSTENPVIGGKVINEISEPREIKGIVYSPDLSKAGDWAYVQKIANNPPEIVTNFDVGISIEGLSEIYNLTISPDGKSVYFAGKNKPERQKVFRNEEELFDAKFDQITKIAISPDGNSWMCVTKNDYSKNETVAVNGKEVDKKVRLESDIVFSPQSDIAAYALYREVKNGPYSTITRSMVHQYSFETGEVTESGHYLRALNPTYSDDGRRFAFCAIRSEEKEYILVLDGNEYELGFEIDRFDNGKEENKPLGIRFFKEGDQEFVEVLCLDNKQISKKTMTLSAAQRWQQETEEQLF
ncbi:hypothetical protein KKC60_04495 [Patescibacteria group bacterium]|nr:hypothetical protein [Patescibacteria group bacterium]